MSFTAVITDHGFPNVDAEARIITAAGGTVSVAQCRSAGEVASVAASADALLVQWAPIDAVAMQALRRCRVIVRYGIGTDNLDLTAARERGIPVCNVPDYGIDEVADHAVSMALALGRQLPQTDARTRAGTWSMLPIQPMPAYRHMTFAVAGLGRIGRAVLTRARGFGFRLAAYDPHLPHAAFASDVSRLDREQLFRQADILSLHLPLTPESRHLVDARSLALMKPTAHLINTARGALVDTPALAAALRDGTIASAGLDVYEQEPLPMDHPLRQCANLLLTSHMAWYSEASGPTLQRLAAEELVRGVTGQPLRNRIA